jgi:hypothetical protein
MSSSINLEACCTRVTWRALWSRCLFTRLLACKCSDVGGVDLPCLSLCFAVVKDQPLWTDCLSKPCQDLIWPHAMLELFSLVRRCCETWQFCSAGVRCRAVQPHSGQHRADCSATRTATSRLDSHFMSRVDQYDDLVVFHRCQDTRQAAGNHLLSEPETRRSGTRNRRGVSTAGEEAAAQTAACASTEARQKKPESKQ